LEAGEKNEAWAAVCLRGEAHIWRALCLLALPAAAGRRKKEKVKG